MDSATTSSGLSWSARDADLRLDAKLDGRRQRHGCSVKILRPCNVQSRREKPRGGWASFGVLKQLNILHSTCYTLSPNATDKIIIARIIAD